MLDQVSFTVFDVETTGLYPYSGDRICEIAAVRKEPSAKCIKKFHSLVDPQRPISYNAFSVNGITDEMVRGKPAIEALLPAFLEFIKGSVLVAYNAGFDLGFIEWALGKDASILNDYRVIDALPLARKLFPGIGRYNLGNVASTLGMREAGEHRALSDALMTWKVFEKELTILAGDGTKTVGDIASAAIRKPVAVRRVKDYKRALIEKAIREEGALSIIYRSAWDNRLTKRVITPKEIREGYDRSYVIAHCHLKGEERNFRLDCILKASRVK